METMQGCVGDDGREIPGRRFRVQSLRELINLIADHGEFHLTHFNADDGKYDEDIDIWIVSPRRQAQAKAR